MPLRDHFHAPLDELRHWEGLHGGWPMMIVASLRRKLPPGFFAEPRVHSGASAEIDVATFEESGNGLSDNGHGNGDQGGVATAVWAPSRPTLAVSTNLPEQDTYEVRVYDERRHCRLVAAVEIVSPANKDRPESRRAFVAKCVGLLREQVSVVIVDIVTSRHRNLYGELLEFLGHDDPTLSSTEPALYSSACRVVRKEDDWRLEAWLNPLTIGRAFPTIPLWLAADLAVPLDLEESYEGSCEILDIP